MVNTNSNIVQLSYYPFSTLSFILFSSKVYIGITKKYDVGAQDFFYIDSYEIQKYLHLYILLTKKKYIDIRYGFYELDELMIYIGGIKNE